ncbi:MAG TPA: diaminopimelate epimerase [Methanomicrobiales archaeon]|jgi:diaminopimelate epimerase|nr:diaminopimelate epimerase [Methanomicrobiales archaeon]
MAELVFTKLQGNGNDFILIDEYEQELLPEELKPKFASLYTDRRFGIGADGILFLSKGEKAPLKMRIFNPDESEAEMCGNGIRCFAKYIVDKGYAEHVVVKENFTVETLAGVIQISTKYDEDEEFFASIGMPAPKFNRSEIPATGEGEYKEEILEYTVYAVNTGVPHAVVFVDEVGAVEMAELAPAIRNHRTFIAGANVNFVEKSGENILHIRTYERGVEAETLSCGTGAMASAAVARKLGMVGDTVRVETVGGPLTIRLGEKNEMEGPARTVFTGSLEL